MYPLRSETLVCQKINMTRRQRTKPEQHAYLSILVERFDARVDADINVDLRGGRPLFSTDDDLVFEAITTLDIKGRCTYPADRAGENYEIAIRSDPSPRSRLTLKDIHARDEYNAPQYRSYRGEQIPVYNTPPGIAMLERRRHDKVWNSCIRVDPQLTTNMLILLGQSRQLYLAIHECKADRRRWIQSISLQTTAPADE